MIPTLFNALAWVAQQQTEAPAGAAGGAAAAPPAGPDLFRMLLPMALIFLVFYFIMMRPQKAEQRKRQEMLNQLGKGDSVITTGGIHGTVESVDAAKGTVTLGVAPKVSVKFSRAAIASVVRKKGTPEPGEAGEAKESRDHGSLASRVKWNA